MQKRFYLKHEDDVVALILLSEVSKEFSKCAIVNRDLLPIGAIDEISLKKWWLRRAVPRTQDGMQRMLNEIGSPHELLFNNLGLSLTDHYWLCPVDISLSWKQVSLYHNPFSEVIYDDSRSSLLEAIRDMMGTNTFHDLKVYLDTVTLLSWAQVNRLLNKIKK